MAAAPLITFKAGCCKVDGRKVTALPTPGYLYLYSEDDLLHFCWRPRTAQSTDPELDLLMIPTDGNFYPLLKEQGADDLHSPTNGRIFVLKFTSSSQKHLFWLQSKSQAKDGSDSWLSPRDLRLGQIVDGLLQGDDVDVAGELEDLRNNDGDDGPDGDADAMEIDHSSSLSRQRSGGAGQDATGGDPRQEGESSREGGADGGRARNQDANQVVQNFLNSFAGGSNQQQGADRPFTTLPDLLPSSVTISYIQSASSQEIDELCMLLPPELFLIAQESTASTSEAASSPAAAQAAIESLSVDQKKEVITRVLHSPQLQQSLASLTVALRDGGLPMIGEALGLRVENAGHIKGGSMPLGGGEAVEAFMAGVKKTVDERKDQERR